MFNFVIFCLLIVNGRSFIYTLLFAGWLHVGFCFLVVACRRLSVVLMAGTPKQNVSDIVTRNNLDWTAKLKSHHQKNDLSSVSSDSVSVVPAEPIDHLPDLAQFVAINTRETCRKFCSQLPHSAHCQQTLSGLSRRSWSFQWRIVKARFFKFQGKSHWENVTVADLLGPAFRHLPFCGLHEVFLPQGPRTWEQS